MLIEGTLTDFSDALASKSPTPGGGGAAGVAGALAAACGSMVANLLDGKARVADHQSDIERIAARLEELRRDLLSVVDEDAHAFEPVAEALALPRDTPEQTAVRVSRMQSALEDACQPPFKCMNLALDVLKALDELCGYANRLVISDVGVGAELCRAALRASSLNVFVNCGMMSDGPFASQIDMVAREMVESGDKVADGIYERVAEVLHA